MHRLLIVAIGAVIIAAAVATGVAWRLSQGPIDSLWIANRVKAALTDETSSVRVAFGAVALTWDGFQKGVDYPLDLHVADFTLTDTAGHRLLQAGKAQLRFSTSDLILGRWVPRTLEVEGAQFSITRETAGLLETGDTTDAGSYDLRQLGHDDTHGPGLKLPPQLQRVHFRDTEVTFRDPASALVVQTPGMDLDLIRGPRDHVHGSLQGPLHVDTEQAELMATLDWVPGVNGTLSFHMTPFRPAVLAKSPTLAFLQSLDLPIALAGTVAFADDFNPSEAQLTAQLGEGRLRIGNGALPLRGGRIVATATPHRLEISQGHLSLLRAADGKDETADITGTVTLVADRLSGSLTTHAEHIDAADLPRLWPEGVAKGARPWVTQHIIAGMAHGTASFSMESDRRLNNVALTAALGDLTVSNAAFTWIDNVLPIEQADAHLHLLDPDTLDITVFSGHQRIRGRTGDLLVKDGKMRITGLSGRDQFGEIHTQVDGPILSALALLSEPRLHLLSDHPIGLKPSVGDASAKLAVQLPLQNSLTIDDVQIHTDAHLSHIRVPDAIAGRPLDDTNLDLIIDKDSLKLKGAGALAAVPVTLAGALDFTAGPSDQVVQRVTVAGTPDSSQLDAAGVHVTDFMNGLVPLTAVMMERRNGDGTVSITGDLSASTLIFGPLAWRKPAGPGANLAAVIRLSHDRLARVDQITVHGDDVLLTGSAQFADGKARSLLLDTIRLGRTQGHGTIHFLANNALGIVLQGRSVDLGPKLTETTPADPNAKPVTNPPWSLEARFDHALLANDETAGNLLVTAAGGGERIRTLDVLGSADSASFGLRIEPQGLKRRLMIQAADAGRFLRGMDIVRGMSSGRLSVDGTVDSPAGLSPLTAQATIDNVVVRNSPALAKLLQAITLYGLVDALSGPGMAFPHVAVPFRYDGNNIYLDNALASNPSLGLTAQGRIGLASSDMAVTGTIIPAYFFNAIPGQLPLIGRLFSPEKGGGVFAARFDVTGPTQDPTITINAASALTPGFLRGIFNLFEKQQPATGVASKPASPNGP